MKMDLLKVISCWLIVVLVSACESNPIPEEKLQEQGVFILNQGGWGANDASLWVYNPESGETSTLISSTAANHLGDLGQDMLIYGSKLYIVVSGSSNIRVLDLATKQDISTIPIFDGEIPGEPRYLAAHNGKIYATCYNGGEGIVARIDTASLQWEGRTGVGAYPEGIAVNAGKLYVANSGYGYGNTVSVVDIATFTELRQITVGTNPNILRADGNYVYLSYQGISWEGVPGGFQRIDVSNNSVVNVSDAPKTDFAIENGHIYYYDVTYDPVDWSTVVSFGKMSVATNGTPNESPLITDNVLIASPYGIAVHPETGEIYIADAGDYTNPGQVFVFDAQGKKKDEFTAGVSPCRFVFY